MKIIPKCNDDWSNKPCWRATETMDGRKLKPIIICRCGLPCGLGNHAISENGRISPSFHHEDCGFHDYLTCDGWDGGSFAKEEGNI